MKWRVSAADSEVVIALCDVEVECPCSKSGDYGKAWIRLAPEEALLLARQLLDAASSL